MKKKIKWVVSLTGIILIILGFAWTSVNAQAQKKTVLVVTYGDGSKQSLDLNQASANIVKIEFTESAGVRIPRQNEIRYVKGFEGKWNSNWGTLEFTVDGIQVNGNYTHDKGKIEAALSGDGKTMEGMWLESPSYKPPTDGGRVIFKLSDDGNSITGHWWYGQDQGGGDWTGTRIK